MTKSVVLHLWHPKFGVLVSRNLTVDGSQFWPTIWDEYKPSKEWLFQTKGGEMDGNPPKIE